MEKRGQLTLFVVLGVVLVILILLMVFYRSAITETVSTKILQKQVVLPADIREIQDHVQRCVEANSLITFYYLGEQGGLLVPSGDKAFVNDDFSVAYGYDKGKNVLPTLVDFRREFSNSMNDFLPGCLASVDFGKLNVVAKEPSTSVDFLDDKVRVSVDYPITVTEGENTFKVDDPYEVEYPLRIKFLHDISDSIVKRTISDPKNIDVSYLIGLGVKVDIYPYDNKTFLYSLEDSRSVYRDVLYNYRFAVRYR
ncbi:MAG: hypothetical protein V1645_03405 [archaeon]